MSDRDREGSTPDDGRNPADTPLIAVLSGFEAEGFDQQFNSREGGKVHCYSCGEDSPAESSAQGPIRRLEGASDPSDMLAVIPVQCPNCGAKGTVVANYGPEAQVPDAEVLLAIERHPTDVEPGT